MKKYIGILSLFLLASCYEIEPLNESLKNPIDLECKFDVTELSYSSIKAENIVNSFFTPLINNCMLCGITFNARFLDSKRYATYTYGLTSNLIHLAAGDYTVKGTVKGSDNFNNAEQYCSLTINSSVNVKANDTYISIPAKMDNDVLLFTNKDDEFIYYYNAYKVNGTYYSSTYYEPAYTICGYKYIFVHSLNNGCIPAVKYNGIMYYLENLEYGHCYYLPDICK